jgi:N-acetylglucosamine kinase-like BadF-type ATPase
MAVMRGWDGRGPATALTPAVLHLFRIARPEDLIQLVYARELSVPAIAAVAPLVGRARDLGDQASAGILARAAAELVLAARAVVDAPGMAGDRFPVFLAGGVAGGIDWLVSEIGRQVAGLLPRADVRRHDTPPVMDAVRLAIAELAGGSTLAEYVRSR